MAVAVFGCVGNKRGFFDVEQCSPSSSSKRSRSLCLSSSSPQPRLPTFHQDNNLAAKVAHILEFFPDMDPQVVADTLQNVDENVDAAIRHLEELRLNASTVSNVESTSISENHHESKFTFSYLNVLIETLSYCVCVYTS